jgi:hypothetical protein
VRFKSLLLASAILPILGCGGGQIPLHDTVASTPQNDEAPADGTVQTFRLGGGSITLRVTRDHFLVSDAQLLRWVQTGAKAVTNYLGKFPVARLTIEITREGDSDEIHGTEYEGSLIRMRIGPETTAAEIADDWTMTHEMLHLAFPNMGEDHLWMNEGLSVYLEPVARARIGVISPKRYWRELFEGVANGQPGPGDEGVDRTHTWGRTYWGGTIFWFLVDLEIREQTHGRKSIDDVVKTILAAGGDGSQEWPMPRVLEMADQASGTHVMHDVYDMLALKPTRVDFGPWWQRLGVRYADGNVTFDDTAPLAWMRKAILAPDGRGTP